MTPTLSCSRCGREAQGLEQRPRLPPALADEVMARVCADCWREWEPQEVIIINELRLNFMDPRSADILHQKLREFLGLVPGVPPSAPAGPAS